MIIDIVLNIIITMVCLSIIMIILLFTISGKDVMKTQKSFLTDMANDVKTTWLFGGFNMKQSILNNKNMSDKFQKDYENLIKQTQIEANIRQKEVDEENNKLLKKAILIPIISGLIMILLSAYGIKTNIFSLSTCIIAFFVTFILLGSELLFYYTVVKPYTHSRIRILYHKILTKFLEKENTFKIPNNSSTNEFNNKKYCSYIKNIRDDNTLPNNL